MIRRYRDSDFEDVKYLNDLCFERPCTENELRAKLAGNVWVWEADPAVSSVVGAIILDRDLIWSVTVAPAFRRRGIATALMLEAETAGLPLHLHTEPDSPGNHLYTKLGYTASEIERDFYGPGRDAVLMRKA